MRKVKNEVFKHIYLNIFGYLICCLRLLERFRHGNFCDRRCNGSRVNPSSPAFHLLCDIESVALFERGKTR